MRIIFRSENNNEKTIVANSVLPKIIMESDNKLIKPILNGNTGYPKYSLAKSPFDSE